MKLLFGLVLMFSIQLNSKNLYDFEQKVYTIQVFSSKNKIESKNFLLDYLEEGNPFVWPKSINNEIWYRSCIDIFFSKEEADNRLLLIKTKRKEAFVIELISN